MRIILLLILIFSSCCSIAETVQPIPADQAFRFSAMARDYQTAVIMWDIKPGYYIYRDRIHLLTPNTQTRLGQPLFPPAEIKHYKAIGNYPVYEGNLKIAIPVIHLPESDLVLQVSYQGCAASGFCYPPQSKVIKLDMSGDYFHRVTGIDADIALPASSPLTQPSLKQSTDQTSAALKQHNVFLIVLTFLGFGLLLSMTPCVLPMIPILSSIILGHDKITTTRAFGLSLAYVLGMAITYAIAGIIFGFIGSNLQTALQVPWVIILFSLIFVAMALSLFGFYSIQLPTSIRHKLSEMSQHQKHGSYIGVAIMGVLSTLILSPCVTPPLVGVLGYISNTGNAAIGGLALFAMGIGMGIPLLIIGTFGPKLIPKSGVWMNTIKYLLGVMMLALAIIMLSRIIIGPVILLLWAALAIGCAIFLGAFTTAPTQRQKLFKALGIALFVYGIVLIIGATSGNNNPLKPLSLQRKAQTNVLNFIPVKTVADIKKELAIAAQNGQPVMLDFYATWCVSCKEMDYFTFADPQVQSALSHFRLLRADVTNNDAQAKALEKYFNVVAPPTLIFFNANQEEIKQGRIVGEMGATQFLNHLKSLPLA